MTAGLKGQTASNQLVFEHRAQCELENDSNNDNMSILVAWRRGIRFKP